MNNVIAYSGDDPPQIQISVERSGGEYVFSVRGEGIGIPASESEQIFEVFQSLHPSEDHSGTGIGLALCERIVERHGVRPNDERPGSTGERSESVGGDIWVDSEPGEGATFTFTLPRNEV